MKLKLFIVHYFLNTRGRYRHTDRAALPCFFNVRPNAEYRSFDSFARVSKKVTQKALETIFRCPSPGAGTPTEGCWVGLQLPLWGSTCHLPSHPILRLSSSGQLFGRVWTVSQVRANLCRDPACYFQGHSFKTGFMSST